MHVYVKSYSLGYVEALPVRAEYCKRIREHLREFMPKGDAKALVFFQSIEEAAQALNLTPRNLRDLDDGYCITKRVDDWEFLHCYGYDTHELAETGCLYAPMKKAQTRRNSDEKEVHSGA